MQDLDHVLQDLKEPHFLERTLTQTPDRAELGYPDEWQLLLAGTTHDGKQYLQELAYYCAAQWEPTEEFVLGFQSKADEYRSAYPNVPFSQEQVHHSQGIHHDQRLPITPVDSRRVNH